MSRCCYGAVINGAFTQTSGTTTLTSGSSSGDCQVMGLNATGTVSVSGGTFSATSGSSASGPAYGAYVSNKTTLSGGTVSFKSGVGKTASYGINTASFTHEGANTSISSGACTAGPCYGICVQSAPNLYKGTLNITSGDSAGGLCCGMCVSNMASSGAAYYDFQIKSGYNIVMNIDSGNSTASSGGACYGLYAANAYIHGGTVSINCGTSTSSTIYGTYLTGSFTCDNSAATVTLSSEDATAASC